MDAPRELCVDPTPIASLSIPIDDARRLCAAGLIAFARGDIAAARALLRRAAEGGDPRALMALGDTYDPTTLSRLGALGLKGDEKQARVTIRARPPPASAARGNGWPRSPSCNRPDHTDDREPKLKGRSATRRGPDPHAPLVSQKSRLA